MFHRNSTTVGFAYIWQSKWVGKIAIKTKIAQIHLSDVIVAVASYDLRSYYTRRFATTILAQHSVVVLEQCCNHSKQFRNNVATLSRAKNRRCESLVWHPRKVPNNWPFYSPVLSALVFQRLEVSSEGEGGGGGGAGRSWNWLMHYDSEKRALYV